MILFPLLLGSALTASDFNAASAILRAKCVACHNAKARTAGLSMESRDDILRGGKSGGAIIPGKPLDSLIMSMVSTGRMPPNGAKLTGPEVKTIREWIEREDQRPPVAERDVHAILSAKCWVCHGRRDKRADLDLRSREALLHGGKSGPAIVPGNPEASLLVKRIAAQEMPPPKLQEQYSVRGLTDDEFAKVKQWIADGAPPGTETPLEVSSANDPAVTAKDRAFWAFQTPQRAALPNVARHPVDAALSEKRKTPPAAEASASALLRRAYFDLTGLPPTPEDVTAYLNDTSPDRYARLIDRLLESPRYGERWGRHWLDVAGYADSEGGNNSDQARLHAWRYRDYVVRSFNANKPYDRFLTEQIAGDELFDYRKVSRLTPEHLDLMAATGFWRTAPDGTNSTEQNFIPERMDVIAGQIEVFGSAILGLSVGCARCHDHKYDPIPTRDYYRLAAVLTPAYDPYHWLPGEFPCGGVGAKCDENNTRYFIPKATTEYEEAQAHNAPFDARIKEMEKELAGKAEKERAAINERIRAERTKRKPIPLVRALFDLGPEPPPTRILLRGDPSTPGALVAPGALSAATGAVPDYRVEPLAHSSGRRLALAKWVTHPSHPLTARVMVNRIWLHHFGTGLVTTPGNFGRMGAAPENQKLLDWLAAEFVRTGWDIKAMHRLIMTSATYRQRTVEGGFPLRRLDAESIRDAILAMSGRLDIKPFGPADAIRQLPDGEVITESLRRSIYVTQRRTRPISVLEGFDQPFMNPNCVQRGQSVVSSQALHLLNSDLTRQNSRFMAGRIIDAAGDNRTRQVERAYLLALARPPTPDESAAALTTLDRLAAEWRKQLQSEKPEEPVEPRSRWLALATLCHTLMNSAEFLYVE